MFLCQDVYVTETQDLKPHKVCKSSSLDMSIIKMPTLAIQLATNVGKKANFGLGGEDDGEEEEESDASSPVPNSQSLAVWQSQKNIKIHNLSDLKRKIVSMV